MPTYEGTILDTGGAVINVRSSAYGATGNGVTDDTAAIQAAVNAAKLVPRGTVLIPPGTYVVTSVVLTPGITISGYGATLLRPANQPEWTRTLTVPENPNLPGVWGGPKDSDPLVIEGLTLDGNSLNQGHVEYNREHSHLIFLSASPVQPGRIRATLKDLVVRNVTGDGISLYTNVDAQIVNCRADDCFRGGLTVLGGNTRVEVQNLITTGNLHRTGIDVEVDGYGYGNTRRVDLTIDGLILEADFDVAVRDGSTVTATNVISGPGFHLEALDSRVHIANSRFQIATAGERIVWPHDVTFDGCAFEVVAGNGVDVHWNINGTTEDKQRLRFRNCEFRAVEGSAPGGHLVGIVTQGDVEPQDNRLIVEGGSISSAFQVGMRMTQGGNWIVKEVEIEAATAFDWNGLVTGENTATTADIRLERVVSSGATYMHVANNHVGNVLDQRDVVLDEAQNVITANYAIGGNRYRGGRIIRVVSSPVGRSIPGFVGDVARLAEPVAGQPYEWVCTATSETAATWKQAVALAA